MRNIIVIFFNNCKYLILNNYGIVEYNAFKARAQYKAHFFFVKNIPRGTFLY